MKKLTIAIIAVLMIVVTGTAWAEILNHKIESVTVATDKNGNEYVRIIIAVEKTESGVTYSVGMPAMVFSSTGAETMNAAKALKAGDTLKAAASLRKAPGFNDSYTIHKILPSNDG